MSNRYVQNYVGDAAVDVSYYEKGMFENDLAFTPVMGGEESSHFCKREYALD